MALKVKKESEIATAVMEFFADWNLWPEVPLADGGIIDVYAIRGTTTMAIEAKMHLNFQVLHQAYRNKARAHFSYIAVPEPKNTPEFFKRVCKDYGIGVLYIDKKDSIIREGIKPRFNKRIKQPKLADWMKQSAAGSQYDRVTAYSYAIDQIVMNLRRNNNRMNMANVFEKTTYHWKSITSAQECIKTYIRKKIITQFRIESGYLVLNKEYDGKDSARERLHETEVMPERELDVQPDT